VFRAIGGARLAGIVLVLLLVSACASRNAAPVVKLGVIAPFEGAGRPLGYAVLPVVKDVVAQANQREAFGRYRVAVVAFNDDLDPATAAQQAQALALDGDVLAVLGPFTLETIAAAAPVLREAGVAHAAFPAAAPTAKDHAADVVAAREAAAALVTALAADIAGDGQPSRAGLAAARAAP
jgi:ABC-type branched-subunit amino acid transport system substrate-binding protein